MTAHYFAFGSNMSSVRLLARVEDARPLGRALLRDHAFVCNKRGQDGSAKANIEPREGASVWGVLFVVPRADLARLDRIEGGYVRTEVMVDHEGTTVTCFTYLSTRRLDGGRPFDWYKAHIVDGAVEFGLPADYVATLRALPADPAR